MKLDVKFEEQDKSFGVDFNEQTETIDAEFGEVQVIAGGGENGATFIPNVSSDGIISWTNDKNLENPTPVNIKGEKGEKGEQGLKGADGLNGKDGEKGQDGTNGVDGKDGFSPIVSVADIEGGHKVTITDKNGAKTFDVMDGKDGQGGSGGESVQADWEQNDSTAKDYIKNRPFYIEYEYEPIELATYSTSDIVNGTVDSINLSMFGMDLFYKASDVIPEKEQVLSSQLCDNIPYNEYSKIVYDEELSALCGQDIYRGTVFDSFGHNPIWDGNIIVVKQAGTINIMGVDVVLPSTGIYKPDIHSAFWVNFLAKYNLKKTK